MLLKCHNMKELKMALKEATIGLNMFLEQCGCRIRFSNVKIRISVTLEYFVPIQNYGRSKLIGG